MTRRGTPYCGFITLSFSSWCGCKGVHGPDAEDVAQDVFRAVMTGLHGFRRDRPGDSFRAWLRGITHLRVKRYYSRTAAGPLRRRAVPSAFGSWNRCPPPLMRRIPPNRSGCCTAAPWSWWRGEVEERTWQMFWRSVVEDETPTAAGADLGVDACSPLRQARSRVLRRLKEEVSELLD